MIGKDNMVGPVSDEASPILGSGVGNRGVN